MFGYLLGQQDHLLNLLIFCVCGTIELTQSAMLKISDLPKKI